MLRAVISVSWLYLRDCRITIGNLQVAIRHFFKSDSADHLVRENQSGLAAQKLEQNRHALTPLHLPIKDCFKAG